MGEFGKVEVGLAAAVRRPEASKGDGVRLRLTHSPDFCEVQLSLA